MTRRPNVILVLYFHVSPFLNFYNKLSRYFEHIILICENTKRKEIWLWLRWFILFWEFKRRKKLYVYFCKYKTNLFKHWLSVNELVRQYLCATFSLYFYKGRGFHLSCYSKHPNFIFNSFLDRCQNDLIW